MLYACRQTLHGLQPCVLYTGFSVGAFPRKEAAEKEEELKVLVGARYHNLLDSVDDAVSMSQCTEKLQALFQQLHKASGRI